MTVKNDQLIGLILKKAQNSKELGRVLPLVRSSLSLNKRFIILSANPEIVLLALKDSNLASILLSSDILINDGVGLSMAYDFLSKRKIKNKLLAFFVYLFQGFEVGLTNLISKDKQVLKGRVLFMEIVKLANKLNWRIFLLGGSKDEANRTLIKLKRSFKKIQIESDNGATLDLFGRPISKVEEEKQQKTVSKINSFKPDVIFAAFGAPKQEYWINNNLKVLNTKGIMAVGGTFNYISGNLRLPENIFEQLGLEWLWRMIIEPKRIVRIIKAVFVFPLKVFLYKLSI